MHPTGKGGKRKDLGNVYFRSRWEANWARYLNFLLQNRIIKKWDFEPETFEFHDIKKGNRFYTPDFRVVLSDDRVVYHEVKGWMTPKSETKIKRFRKRYPNHQLEVVDRVRYRAIARQLGNYLPNWEICESHGKYWVMRKYNEAAIMGWIVIRRTPSNATNAECADLIKRAIAARLDSNAASPIRQA